MGVLSRSSMLYCVNYHVSASCVQHSAGESLYMLFRAIKHQVDKGPVDAVTGKAKYTLNDNRLLREDLEYHTLVRIFEYLYYELNIFITPFQCISLIAFCQKAFVKKRKCFNDSNTSFQLTDYVCSYSITMFGYIFIF